MSTCPMCAEEVPAGSTRCPHCGESFVLPPLQPEKAPLPPAVRALAWGLLLLGLLRLGSSTQIAWFLFGVGPGLGDYARIVVMQLGHTALVFAAGVALLQARSWAPIVAWLQAGLTVFHLGSYALSFVGIGLGALRLDVYSALVLPVSLVVLVLTVVVLLRPDVQAFFRAGK